MNELTQSRLKELLDYDPITGIFTWLKRCNQLKTGDVAGCHDYQGYIVIMIDRIQHRAGRLAWLYVHGIWPSYQIDHKDRIRDNDAIVNLREATHSTNGMNRGISTRNTSGVTGVSLDKRSGKWRACIKVSGKPIHLGLFASKDAAALSRGEAEKKHGFAELCIEALRAKGSGE